MRKLFVLLAFLSLACGPLPENEVLTEIDEFFNTPPLQMDVPLSIHSPSIDRRDVRICPKELVSIGENCWLVICHKPCMPTDPGCLDFYCEWSDGTSTPR